MHVRLTRARSSRDGRRARGHRTGGSHGAPEGSVANDERSFVTLCRFSHRNTDDPIVLPRRPGTSHDHSYVGNVSTDAFSTLSSLERAGTTCDRTKDKAAYWAPTLYENGVPVDPYGAVVPAHHRAGARLPGRPHDRRGQLAMRGR